MESLLSEAFVIISNEMFSERSYFINAFFFPYVQLHSILKSSTTNNRGWMILVERCDKIVT